MVLWCNWWSTVQSKWAAYSEACPWVFILILLFVPLVFHKWVKGRDAQRSQKSAIVVGEQNNKCPKKPKYFLELVRKDAKKTICNDHLYNQLLLYHFAGAGKKRNQQKQCWRLLNVVCCADWSYRSFGWVPDQEDVVDGRRSLIH